MSGSLKPNCFPKRLKLRRRFEFQKVLKQGQRLVGQSICIDYRETAFPDTRLGITASCRYGNSPERNRFKRIVREAFRTARSELPSSLDLNVLPRQRAKTATSASIRKELISLLKRKAQKQESKTEISLV